MAADNSGGPFKEERNREELAQGRMWGARGGWGGTAPWGPSSELAGTLFLLSQAALSLTSLLSGTECEPRSQI